MERLVSNILIFPLQLYAVVALQYLTVISHLVDARWFLTSAGIVSFSQTLPDVPRCTSENHPFRGPLQRIPGSPGVSTPSLGRHHHPGVYEGNDRSPTL